MKKLKCPFCQKTIGRYDATWASEKPDAFKAWVESRIHIHENEDIVTKREIIDELINLIERIEEHYDYKDGETIPEIKKTKEILKNL
jgi:hypothetical protein